MKNCKCGKTSDVLVHWRNDDDEDMCQKCLNEYIGKRYGGYYESTLLAKAETQERTRVA